MQNWKSPVGQVNANVIKLSFDHPYVTGDERSVRLENIREDVTFPIENNVRHHVILPIGCPPCRFYFEALSFYLAEDVDGRTRSLRLLGLFTGVPILVPFSRDAY